MGKSKAMEMVLTGGVMRAEEAERCGLVSHMVPASDLMSEVQSPAKTIAEMSKPITMIAKEALNTAYENTLDEGLLFERRLNHACFVIEEQKAGMAAFTEGCAANLPPTTKKKDPDE